MASALMGSRLRAGMTIVASVAWMERQRNPGMASTVSCNVFPRISLRFMRATDCNEACLYWALRPSPGRDAKAGKLDKLAEAAKAHHRAGLRQVI